MKLLRQLYERRSTFVEVVPLTVVRTLLVLALLIHLTEAIYDPYLPTNPPKYKHRPDLEVKPAASTTTSEPILVYHGRRTRPNGRPRARPPPSVASHGHRERPAGRTPAKPEPPTPRRAITSGLPRQKPPEGDLCPTPNGLFPHPSDCAKYVNCAHGRSYIQSCAQGTLFNPQISICDFPYNVECDSTSSSSSSSSSSGSPVGAESRTINRVNKDPPFTSPSSSPSSSSSSSTQKPSSSSSSVSSLFGSVIESVGTVVNKVKDVKEKAEDTFTKVYDVVGNVSITHIKDKVDWAVLRTVDKGRRALRKVGLSKGSTLCPLSDGLFPYSKDCAQYVNCWKGRPFLQKCPSGLLFNPSTSVCDWPSRVVCPHSRAGSAGDDVAFVISPPSGQILGLRGGNAPWAGYVEMEVGGLRGLVADKEGGWSIKDAHVVCVTLGFKRGAASAVQGRKFGPIPDRPVVAKRVTCTGDEDDVSRCQIELGERERLDQTVAGVRCQRNWVSSCEMGWERWGDRCYRADVTKRLTHSNARQVCERDGARLVTITSQRENDFISDLLTALEDDEKGFHTGGVRTKIFGDTFWLWQNAEISPAPKLNFTKWWSGWNSTLEYVEEPWVTVPGPLQETSTTHCIVIRDYFPVHTDPSATTIASNYYFWQVADCGETLHYVCEKPALDIGCFQGRGSAYSGVANVSEEGVPCLKWTHPDVVTRLRPHHIRNLRENYCANPDGEDRPWCFTGRGGMDFCDIPKCKEDHSTEEGGIDLPSSTSTSPSSTSTESCEADTFRCNNGECIYQAYECDGINDCDDASDESGCRDYTDEFKKHHGKRLRGHEKEKWLYTLKHICAHRCIHAKSFVCKSFNYEQENETCMLSDSTVGESGSLQDDSRWEYHEMKRFTIDCTNSFVCEDGKCINNSMKCDGKMDCKGGEDEVNCEDQVRFQARLVNGSTPYEGRVEVQAFGKWGLVCDDSWDLPDGDVVCRQLGFNLGAKEVFTSARFGTGDVGRSFLMDDVNCFGHEAALDKCNFAGWNEHDCTIKEAAGVSCFNPGDECGRDQFRCQNGRCVQLRFLCDKLDDCLDSSDEEKEMCESPVEVRLVGGDEDPSKEPKSGRVEIKYLGQWGTVCDDDFGIEEGHVLCRMLGWGSAEVVHKNNTYGEGKGQIWLDDLRCLGYETSVADCTFQHWGHTNCDHSEDVGLTCSEEILPELDGRGPAVSTSRPPPASLPQHCGFRTVSDRPKPPPLNVPRIVKGYIPQPGAHPWMAGLRLRTTSGSSHWCGGVILTAEHIMTAAHCVNRYPASTYIVRVGDFDNAELEPEEQEFRAREVLIHPDFAKGLDLNNDIAIIKVKPHKGQVIRFSSLVQPICLPAPDFNYKPGMQCSVAGWGSMGNNVGYSRLMQSTFLPILPDKQCRADHVYGPHRLSDTMFCAGRLEGGVDTCQGDSGGPLVCEIDGHHTTVGITSWGQGCARANKPGVYTRITGFLDWIYDHLV